MTDESQGEWLTSASADFVCVDFQVEEDPALAPAPTEEGFHFDPNAQLPNEGFKFWVLLLARVEHKFYTSTPPEKLNISTGKKILDRKKILDY